jgi:hypothetical protein
MIVAFTTGFAANVKMPQRTRLKGRAPPIDERVPVESSGDRSGQEVVS